MTSVTGNIVVGIILLVASVFLTIAILMQEGKNSKLSGAIAGGSDNFLGKNKKGGSSARLSAITTVVAICFVVVVLVLYILQPTANRLDPSKVQGSDPDAVSDVAGDKDSEADDKKDKDEADSSKADADKETEDKTDDAKSGEADGE